jgi:hypothetical protein
VFVCGVARSGTSLLGRNVARLGNCTSFQNTGARGDEGQFLQDVYPIATAYGGAGRVGCDPRAHRTETSELLTPENVAKLRASWHAYWKKSKIDLRVENAGQLAYDMVSASRVSQFLLRSDQTASRAAKDVDERDGKST